MLNCKFRFYNWIPGFRLRFLHRGNHRAVQVKNRVDRVLGTTGTWKKLVPWRFNFFSTDLVPKYRVFWQHYNRVSQFSPTNISKFTERLRWFRSDIKECLITHNPFWFSPDHLDKCHLVHRRVDQVKHPGLDHTDYYHGLAWTKTEWKLNLYLRTFMSTFF